VSNAKPFNICVLASGGGGNFQTLIDQREAVGYTLLKLLSDRPCGALHRAEAHGITALMLDRKASGEAFFERLSAEIPAHTDLIVLAGFLPILPPAFCRQWSGKIINIHPSLLPAHGGKGMYGVHVQEAVLRAGDPFAGCSVHYVTEVVDGGEVILQARIAVDPDESAWDLGGRVFQEENTLLVQVVAKLMAEQSRAR